jgi:hypothetical protein
MSNMSYCRFQNTLRDLQDCQDHINDGNLDQHEKSARMELIRVCMEIVDDYEDDQEDKYTGAENERVT